MLAALNLGHFGVKLHGSDDAGASWHELAAPAYPEQPADAAGPAWKLVQIWSLEARGGTVWAGTHPGGLFRSDDRGASWQLVDALWDRPERLEWFGGGYDAPGIHSICLHPERRPRAAARHQLRRRLGDARRRRELDASADGMRAAYMPPEQAGNPNVQDPHAIVRSPADPSVLWAQHHNGIFRSTDNAASWHEITSAPLSSFGFAVATDPHDADAPGSCRRRRPAARAGRRRAGGQLAPATAARPSRRCAPACRRATATTSSIGTASRSTRAAGSC
jgi:hypothetical protein